MSTYFLSHTKTWIREHKTILLLSILTFLALSIAFAAGYLTARDFTQTPIIIQQNKI